MIPGGVGVEGEAQGEEEGGGEGRKRRMVLVGHNVAIYKRLGEENINIIQKKIIKPQKEKQKEKERDKRNTKSMGKQGLKWQ